MAYGSNPHQQCDVPYGHNPHTWHIPMYDEAQTYLGAQHFDCEGK